MNNRKKVILIMLILVCMSLIGCKSKNIDSGGVSNNDNSKIDTEQEETKPEEDNTDEKGGESESSKPADAEKISIHLTFEENGGTQVKDLVYSEGETIDTAAFGVPEKYNCSFLGWFTDKELKKPAETRFYAKKDMTFYAAYIELSHVKGELLSVPTKEIEGVKDAGLFTCKYCGEQYYDTVSYEDVGIPVIDLNGSFSGISKENEVQIKSSFDMGEYSFSCDATVKLQGGTSLELPKKNYNIKLYKSDTNYSKKEKVELLTGYGKLNKYTLKANYVDYSEARNVVSGDIWGDIVRARKIKNELTTLPNGGAVDGIPVLVFENGEYQGLYTLNTAKNGSMFGMDDKTVKQAVISTNNWSDAVKLREHLAEDWSNGWEIEYCSTEDNELIGTSWITESFNEFIDFLNNNDGEELKAGLDEYVDVEAAIDVLLYTTFMYGKDNVAKNMLWATYDGKKWIPSVYDMDDSWGLIYNGSFGYSASYAWFPYQETSLWEKLWKNYHDEVIDRYKELREGPLSLANINRRFSEFFDSIPDILYTAESEKWVDVPNQNANHETQIISWASTRAKTMDAFFGVTVDEKCFNATFSIDNGGTITIYKTQNYNQRGDISLKTVARNGETGLLDTTGEGQINFQVNVPEGYKIETINVSGEYKSLNGPESTGQSNIYCITKVKGDLTITVHLVPAE